MGSCISTSAAKDHASNNRKQESVLLHPDVATVLSATKGEESSKSHDSSLTLGRDNLVKWKQELTESCNITHAVVNIETSLTKRVEDVYDGIHDGPILGTGAAGIVRKCTHRETGIHFAAKCLNLGLIDNEAAIDSLREEIFIMCQANHPDIIRLEEVYESDSQIYLILDLMTGGDMFDRLEEQPEYRYSEARCANIVKQMVKSVRYLHDNNIIHRDLKLENFLFEDKETDDIRLIDFGLAKHFERQGVKHHDAVGTPYTVAPEIIRGEYDEKADVWAIGIITYVLLCGDPPFGGMDGESLGRVKQNILKGELDFQPAYIWDNISAAAKNFIRRCLTIDLDQRPSAVEAQNDDWFTLSANLDPHQVEPLNPKLVQNLLEFKDYSDLQQILLEVVSFTMVPEQIKALKQEFEKLDIDGTGDISLEELKEVLLHRMPPANADSKSTGRGATERQLTEDQVEALFESLRLNTNQTKIQWHKFISAGLSRCDYDDRNLKLAFDRLDRADKGYINLSDLNELISSNTDHIDKDIMNVWKEAMKEAQCIDNDKVNFEDFKTFFKGHRSSLAELPPPCSSNHGKRSSLAHFAEWNAKRLSSVCILSSAFSKRESRKRNKYDSVSSTPSSLRSSDAAILVHSRRSIAAKTPRV